MVRWRLVWERYTGGRRELVVDSVAALRAARRVALDHPDTVAVKFFRLYDNRSSAAYCAAGHAVPPAQVSVRDVCRCGLAHVNIGSCGHLGCTAPRGWDPPFGEGCGPLPEDPEKPRVPLRSP